MLCLHPVLSAPTEKEAAALLLADDDDEAISYSREIFDALRVATYIAASQCCRMVVFSTDQAFVGHIGKAELAGAGLSRSWVSLVSTPISGAVASLNTLCSQAAGAGNPRLAGVWLQLVGVVCAVLLVPTILSLFWMDDAVASFVPACATSNVCDLAGTFSRWTALTLLPMLCCKIAYVYFQALGVVSSAFWTSLLVIVVNVAFNWVLVFGVRGFQGLGFIGSPIATACSVLVQLACFWLWTVTYRQQQRAGWGGWALSEAFSKRRIRQFLGQAGPAVLALSLDRWAYQILGLLVARYLDPGALAAHSVLNTLWGLVWSLNHGIAISTQIGVSTNLGKKRIGRAKFRAALGVATNACFMSVVATGFWLSRKHVGSVWSRSEEVVACVADAVPAFLCAALLASFVLIFQRILDGMAHAHLVAWVSAAGQPWVLVALATDRIRQQATADRLTTVWYLCAVTSAGQAALLLAFILSLSWERALEKVCGMTDKALETEEEATDLNPSPTQP